MFSLGKAKVPKELQLSTPISLNEYHQSNIGMILFLTSGLLSTLMSILSKEIDLGDIADQSHKLYIDFGTRLFPGGNDFQSLGQTSGT
jgi:hypothetical protein